MSSILNALKKLETDTGGKSEHLPPDARVINRNVRGIRILNKLLTILITALCVIGSVWLLITLKPDLIWKHYPAAVSEKTSEPPQTAAEPPPSAPVAILNTDKPPVQTQPDAAQDTAADASQPRKPSVLSPPMSVQEPTPAKPVIIVKTDMDRVQRTEDRGRMTEDAGQRTDASPLPEQVSADDLEEFEDSDEAADDGELTTEDNRQRTGDAGQITDAGPVTGGDSGTDSAPKLHEASGENNHDGVNILPDGRLKIQALVWANNPGSRFAVINDRVVKHGGFINEVFSLAYIGSNYVIVNDGKNQWKVEFHIK